MKKTTTIALSATPPTEFRLFVAGWNETTKGSFLFDDEAATAVMAAYAEHGVDLAIDLEHQALEPGASADPTARDARGWFGLEVRNGELFAINVKWTDDGAARLTEKRQRYISPAFETEPETNRVLKIINAALTAIPATHQTPALIAASQRKNETMATPEANPTPKLTDAIAALEAGDADVALAIMKALADAEAATEKDAPPEAPAEDKAAKATILRATSTKTLVAAAAEVKALAKERQALAAERDEYASAERTRLCARLVADANHAPASVWADPFVKGVPKPFLQRMTIAELREHVDSEVAAVPSGRRTIQTKQIRPPVTTMPNGGGETTPNGGGEIVRASYGDVHLSTREIAMFANAPDADARMKQYVESSFVRRRHEERRAGGGQ